MTSIGENIRALQSAIPTGVKLVAVSKTKTRTMIMEAYDAGQRIFGENYVQELEEKYHQLPGDIQWHFIGHLQSNKVKFIAPFVSLIHGVDNEKLLREINKQAIKFERVIPCLLQVHIAAEETKFGWSEEELLRYLDGGTWKELSHVEIHGMMGMASFTEDAQQVRREFGSLKNLFDRIHASHFANASHFRELSMGMSSDWKMAVEEGSTMVRIGSSIFGERS